jgi:hypothetical protein
MKTKPTLVLFIHLALFFHAVNGASVQFSGTTFMSDTSENIPWVLGSVMFESLDSGTATGTSQQGFTFFETNNVNLLTWTFGDLELSSFQSPGVATPGFEIYTETDGNEVPFTLDYDSSVAAVGVVSWLRVDVSNSSDLAATGTAEVILQNPGSDPELFNEIMSLSGNTGILYFTINEFDPVSFGQFASTGSFTVVPEPSTFASLAGAFILAYVLRRRLAAASSKR